MSTNLLRSAAGAALALILAASAVAVLAAPPAAARDLTVTAPRQSELLTERVSLAGLDLASKDDRLLLDRRLRAASGRVCAPVSVGFPGTIENRCRSAAMEDARDQLARRAASDSILTASIVVRAIPG
ncbi:hypothetical protein GCM10022280_23360 [Sphingomonas swuensis]|uniref:UrcA family protein n=1 Tax=Sphingomonas swuensis TaxID=977800 RepID=A0ABP7T7H4_9SPHN